MKKNQKRKIIVTGGGTGGHAIPVMAIIEELKKHNTEILYIGSGSEIEKQLAKQYQIGYKQILSGKWRRYFDWQNFIDIFKIIIGIIQSFFIVLFFNPEVVFSKGGYVGLPTVWSSWILGKKIYIHETDSILGLANRLALKKCRKIFVGFPAKYYHNLPIEKIVYTGNPIRSDFIKLKKEKLFNNDKQTVLVTGGSQGARFINQTIAKIVPELVKKYNVIHVCGKLDYAWLSKNKWNDYKLYSFTDKMPSFIQNSDLIISRAGGTIFEIAYCKKPAILIPLPSAANNHQESNARILEKENAAVVLREKNLSSESLFAIIENILDDKQMQKSLIDKICQFDAPDATDNIVKNILD